MCRPPHPHSLHLFWSTPIIAILRFRQPAALAGRFADPLTPFLGTKPLPLPDVSLRLEPLATSGAPPASSPHPSAILTELGAGILPFTGLAVCFIRNRRSFFRCLYWGDRLGRFIEPVPIRKLREHLDGTEVFRGIRFGGKGDILSARRPARKTVRNQGEKLR